MTQAINFDELKAAFAPKPPISTVTQFSRISQPSASTNLESTLKKENIRLSDELKTLTEHVDTLEHGYQKTLRHVNLLMQEKIESDTDLERIHEDKMRLVRHVQSKQQEVESLKKTVNFNEVTQRKLQARIAHQKVDLVKATGKSEALKNEVEMLTKRLKKMNNEINELKHQQTLTQQLKKAFIHLKTKAADKTKTFLEKTAAKIGGVRKSNEPELIKWVSVKKELPKHQCMVFVRNGYESDLASYNPKSRTFRCVNKAIDVLEWAYAG